MAMYTMQVRTLVEQYYLDKNPGMTPEQVKTTKPKIMTDAVWDSVFDFDFPMYDGDTKQNLCSLILRHYYMREIGMETVPLWKLMLETRMNEIMPYYVQLAGTTITMAEAFINRNSTETVKRDGSENEDITRVKTGSDNRTVTGSQESTGSNTTDTTVNRENNSQELYSDTPQDGLQNVLNGTYLTNATIQKSTDGDSSNETGSTTGHVSGTTQDDLTKKENEDNTAEKNYAENLTRIISGFDGDKVETLMKYRETLLEIPKYIIRDLSDLFISIL